MKPTLPTSVLVALYNSCWEAQRSVDAALWADWQEFQQYYTAEKRFCLRDLLRQVRRALGRRRQTRCPSHGVVLRAAPGWKWFLPGFLARKLAHGKEHWTLLDREVIYLATTLETLLCCLEAHQKPELAQLVSLRADLGIAQLLLSFRCWGVPDVSRIPHREHFMQAEWMKPKADVIYEQFKRPA